MYNVFFYERNILLIAKKQARKPNIFKYKSNRVSI